MSRHVMSGGADGGVARLVAGERVAAFGDASGATGAAAVRATVRPERAHAGHDDAHLEHVYSRRPVAAAHQTGV